MVGAPDEVFVESEFLNVEMGGILFDGRGEGETAQSRGGCMKLKGEMVGLPGQVFGEINTLCVNID